MLGRRLVNATVDIVTTEDDCGTTAGLRLPTHDPSVLGRRLAQDALAPGGELVAPAGTLLDGLLVASLTAAGVQSVVVRSPLTCETSDGVCVACYGALPETGRLVELGSAVGVNAAQSINETATQLTFRTYYGPCGRGESETPVGLMRLVALVDSEGIGIGEGRSRWVPVAEALQQLGDDGIGPALAADMHGVFAQQGVPLDRRHFEVIARAMLSRVRITDPGDSDLLPGEVVSRDVLRDRSLRLQTEGRGVPVAETLVTPTGELGRPEESFLAAASYGNPSEVLSRAALQGAADDLSGVRERLIVGKLIPLGTGFSASR